MPELPEVETVCRGLKKSLKGRSFAKVDLYRKNLRIPFPAKLNESLKGRAVKDVARRAKYILIELDDENTLIAHLGMSGRFTVNKKDYKLKKHDHAVITLDNENLLVFNDARRFGLITLAPKKTIEKHTLIKNLGLEPLENSFNGEALFKLFKGKKAPVKNVIMDQRLVVGVGNIYAAESLFMSGISPKRAANKVVKNECEILAQNIKKVLENAIKAGGSTFSDYRNSEGDAGYFQFNFQVYSRENLNCLKCKSKIQRLKQAGRSTFYCPTCQK